MAEQEEAAPGLRSIRALINERVSAAEEGAQLRLEDVEDRLAGLEAQLAALLSAPAAGRFNRRVTRRQGTLLFSAGSATRSERWSQLVHRLQTENAELQSRVNVLEDRVHDLERTLDGVMEYGPAEEAAPESKGLIWPPRLRLG